MTSRSSEAIASAECLAILFSLALWLMFHDTILTFQRSGLRGPAAWFEMNALAVGLSSVITLSMAGSSDLCEELLGALM